MKNENPTYRICRTDGTSEVFNSQTLEGKDGHSLNKSSDFDTLGEQDNSILPIEIKPFPQEIEKTKEQQVEELENGCKNFFELKGESGWNETCGIYGYCPECKQKAKLLKAEIKGCGRKLILTGEKNEI